MRYGIFGGRTGLRVSPLALGTGIFGKAGGYGAEPDEAARILDAYAEAGGNFVDTSDAYNQGGSESLLGELLAARRDTFVLVSKFGRSASADPAPAAVGNSRKAMVQSVEQSLRRLRTDRIDIYLAHLDDGVTPVEEIARGFDDLVRAGKIVHGGLSNFPAWRVAAAAILADLRGWAPIAALQVPYSLVARETEQEFLPMATGLRIGVMAYSPLAGGLLTGKYRKGEAGRAAALPGSVPDADGRSERIVDALEAVAGENACSAGTAALAWVIDRGVVPVIGPRTLAQLSGYLAAVQVELSREQVERLDAASAPAAGYPHDLLATQRERLGIVDARTGRVA